jgi:hypothetical protein
VPLPARQRRRLLIRCRHDARADARRSRGRLSVDARDYRPG